MTCHSVSALGCAQGHTAHLSCPVVGAWPITGPAIGTFACKLKFGSVSAQLTIFVDGHSFSKQVQRPQQGKGRLPGPGQYKMRGDLEPQALSTHPTSPRVSFPIAPKTQADKVHPHCDSYVFQTRVSISASIQLRRFVTNSPACLCTVFCEFMVHFLSPTDSALQPDYTQF